MLRFLRRRLDSLLAGLTLVPTQAFAPNRADDNAIAQAEDAFGFSVGRESFGVHNAGKVRIRGMST